jgi:hypothetical protein
MKNEYVVRDSDGSSCYRIHANDDHTKFSLFDSEGDMLLRQLSYARGNRIPAFDLLLSGL